MEAGHSGSSPLLVLLFTAACAPAPWPEPDDARTLVCDPLELAPGEARAKQVGCTDELPRNSEGQVGDLLLQTASLSVVIRNPAEALTLIGAPGGTIVDAAPPGWNDRLLEAVPILPGGGWMVTEDWRWGADSGGAWVELEGFEVPAIGLGDEPLGTSPLATEGPPARVRYHLDADRPVLTLTGADGLYLHGARLTVPVTTGFYHAGLGYVTDALEMEDLGGAQRLWDVDTLAVARWQDLPAAIWPDSQAISGACDGDRVEVVADDGARVALLDPTFDTTLPYGGVRLVCVAEGYADGAPTDPGTDLTLTPGAPGFLNLRVADEDGVDRPVVVVDGDARVVSPPGGGPLPLGPGARALRIEAGPAFDPWTGAVDVGEDTALAVVLRRAIDAEGWVLADLFRQATPSRVDRSEPARDLALAAAEGVGFAVQSAPDEVGLPYSPDWAARWVRFRAGSLTPTEDAGAVLSWPWGSSNRDAGHGAIPWFGLGARDVLAVARGYDAPNRLTVVDTDWVAVAGPVASWAPLPDLLLVRDADEAGVIVDLLDHGVPVGLVGPLTWIPSGEGFPSAVASERALVEGRSVATTGPLLDLAQGPDGELTVRLQGNVEARVDAVKVWVDGVVVETLPAANGGGVMVDAVVPIRPERWALAVAEGEDWAVSAPLRVW
ncbi:MAG: hypothetical protein H6739_40675 [Alphaproteobacteria bacterium]|nr:hypothetical protein [Alphaproteobacteria bacterium]